MLFSTSQLNHDLQCWPYFCIERSITWRNILNQIFVVNEDKQQSWPHEQRWINHWWEHRSNESLQAEREGEKVLHRWFVCSFFMHDSILQQKHSLNWSISHQTSTLGQWSSPIESSSNFVWLSSFFSSDLVRQSVVDALGWLASWIELESLSLRSSSTCLTRICMLNCVTRDTTAC